MLTPVRILRECLIEAGHRFDPLTPRQQAREDALIAFATQYFADHARRDLSIARFARVSGISRYAIVFHFGDLDALQFQIVKNHLEKLAAVLDEIEDGAPDCQLRRIRAYLAATRTEHGTRTNPQKILLRLTDMLPKDLRDRIAPMRAVLGKKIAGIYGDAVLYSLDHLDFSPAELEIIVQTYLANKPAAPPETPPAASKPMTGWQEEALQQWTKGQRAAAVN